MKYFLLAALLLATTITRAQVKIGNNAGTVSPASLFELESTNKGLLMPRLSTNERNLIQNPPTGLLIYNKTTDELNIYNNGAWQSIANSYTFSYATDNAGQTLASNGVNFQADNFLMNKFSHVLVGYLPSDNYSNIDTLMVNGNIRVGKDAAWSSAATNRVIKFGDGSFATIGEQLGDNKLVFRGKDFSFLPSSAYAGANVGIGTANPLATLHVARGTGTAGTAVFEGTTNGSYFNANAAEHTYINGGKANSLLILNELSAGDIIMATGGGNVYIGHQGSSVPLASLHVKRGSAPEGTAKFEGSTYASHFNYSTTEDTYIRGGKVASKVLINDLVAGDVTIATGGGDVGIGNAAPQARLHVNRGLSNTTAIFQGTSYNSRINSGDAEATYISGGKATSPVYVNDVSAGNVFIANGGGNVGIGVAVPAARLDVNGSIKISGGSPAAGKLLTSDANGLASWQAPASPVNFKANAAIATSVPNNVITQLSFSNESFDNGNGYNNSGSIYFTPSSGVYFLYAQLTFPAFFTGDVSLYFRVNGTVQAFATSKLASSFGETRNLSAMLNLAAGDQVTVIMLQNSGNTINVGGNASSSYFMGYKVN
jgi:hypothetical protein